MCMMCVWCFFADLIYEWCVVRRVCVYVYIFVLCVCVKGSSHQIGWREKNSYIIYRALCKMKVWGPLFNLLGISRQQQQGIKPSSGLSE